MGNLICIETCTKIAEATANPFAYNSVSSSSTSILNLLDRHRCHYNIIVNTKGHEVRKESFKINEAGPNVAFVSDPDDIDLRHFKDTVKREIARAIRAIQNSTEFQEDFLGDSDIKKIVSSSVELVNLLNIVVEDLFTPHVIFRHVAFSKIQRTNSTAYIEFISPSNYPHGMVYYARQNLQTLYIANVANALLDTFLQDSRTSTIAGYVQQKLNNIENKNKEIAFIGLFVFIIIAVVGVIFIIYIYKHYISHYHNVNSLKKPHKYHIHPTLSNHPNLNSEHITRVKNTLLRNTKTNIMNPF